MLVFSDQRLVFLAVPKTGTTAFEMALKGRADIAFSRGRKHLTARNYRRKVEPFLRKIGLEAEVMAVMRAPIDQIRSWYRYRSGDRQAATERGTAGLDFDGFVEAVIADDPPPFAGIGSQHRFLTGRDGALLVDHLFAYERPERLMRFLEERFGAPIAIAPRNVSPVVPAPLSPEMERRLRAARAEEFALHDRLLAAGGHLAAA